MQPRPPLPARVADQAAQLSVGIVGRRARSIAQLSCASDECCAADYLWDWLTPEKRGSYVYSGTDTALTTSTKPKERSLKSVHRECWKCL
jgi:hypothetical protein